MLQWTPSTSNQSEDLSVHEIDVKKGMDEFSKVMDQFGEEHPLDKWEHWGLGAVDKIAIKMQNSGSRPAGVELPGQWGDIHSYNKKPSKYQNKEEK